MLAWLKRMFSIPEEDEITSSYQGKVREHEKAVALARSMRAKADEKIADLQSAIQLSRIRTSSFADLESSIKGAPRDETRRK